MTGLKPHGEISVSVRQCPGRHPGFTASSGRPAQGKSGPERAVVHPELDIPVLRGWPYLAHNAIHDLAALNRAEMLLWDGWGMQLGHGPGPLPEADVAVLDEVCALTADPAVTPAALADLGDRDGLRVPAVVTRFDPAGGPPCQVDVSRVLSRA